MVALLALPVAAMAATPATPAAATLGAAPGVEPAKQATSAAAHAIVQAHDMQVSTIRTPLQ
jgi:hypothetical protein